MTKTFKQLYYVRRGFRCAEGPQEHLRGRKRTQEERLGNKASYLLQVQIGDEDRSLPYGMAVVYLEDFLKRNEAWTD